MSKLRIVLGFVAIVAIAALAWHWLEGTSTASPAPSAPAAVPVEAATAVRKSVPIYVNGLGTAQAFNTVTVTARVDGQLQKINFVEGQEVKKGDVLAQIDPRPFKAVLDQAVAKKAQDQAQLANAQRDLARYADLAKREFASRQQLDTTQALVAQLTAAIQGDQAAIDSAKIQLDYTTITAPISGRTGIRLIDEGNIVHAASTAGIVVITQLHPISVIFTLPEEDLPRLSQAMAAGDVPVWAMARNGKTELDRGKVALIDNQIDQATGTIKLRANFPNPNDTLWPGEFVNARVLLRDQTDALTIPSVAVQRGADGLFVYVIKPDDTVEARPVTIGVDGGGTAIIADGLKNGEKVVVNGQYRLEPGSHVQIRPAKDVAEKATP
jgi:multidrug efflux system membrane fusion protein